MDVGKNHLHDTALVHRILRIDTSRGCVLTQPVGRRKLEHRMDYPKESLYGAPGLVTAYFGSGQIGWLNFF